MGWPRKNEECRLYKERKGAYLLVFLGDKCPDGSYEAVGEVLIDNDPNVPRLASTSVSTWHLYSKCKRVQWSDIPEQWQKALKEWLVGNPKDIRGLWKINH